MDIYIFGAGRMAKEVEWLLHRLDAYKLLGYVERDDSTKIGATISGVPVIRETTFFQKARKGEKLLVAIANGNSTTREDIVERLRSYPNISTPALIDPSTIMDTRPGAVSIGDGTIILAGVTITTNVSIGDFGLINPGCTISHDCLLEDFVTLSPGVHLCGSVHIRTGTLIGAGAVVRDTIVVGTDAVVGMGAVVVKDVDDKLTVIGVPARPMKL